MYEVSVWVPSKGWKKILGTKSLRKAIAKALEFTPLEVRLCDKRPNCSGRTWYSGQAHTPLGDCNSLAQIEKLNESLCIPV